MPDKHFEKQVHQLLEGFPLKPSAPVWEKIEPHIPQKDKNRRAIIYWLLLAGIAITGGLLLYTNGHTNLTNATVASNTTTLAKENSLDNTALTLQNQAGHKTIITQSKPTGAITNTHILTNKKDNTNTRETTSSIENDPATDASAANSQPTEKPGTYTQENDNTNTQNLDKENIAITSQTTNPEYNNAIITNKEPLDSSTNASSAIKNTAVNNAPLVTETKNTNTIDNNTVAAAKKPAISINTAKKWQWGISTMVGRADVVESILSAGQNADKSFLDYSSITELPVNSSRYSFNVSKQVKANASFSIGLSLKKPINKKFSLITGIEYAYHSTQIETGYRIDSNVTVMFNNSMQNNLDVSSYYKPGNINTYNNNYQLIQVPIVIEHSLLQQKKFSVGWNTGVAIAHITSTNALVFDNFNQAFYQNKSLFNKTQLQVLGGVQVAFPAMRRYQINIGPQVQYNFSNLLKSSDYGNQHLFNYGIRASIYLNKK
ncbi:outer membrane beta-barrel protein [Limnovirga soli]|uniref:Outer membrane beta-barrel protein n=1 Tax=Limnovirga soli TaxID=2656915 RepID=A0A8J8JTF7_9BACT|nr:outer membrane beta-barrel protein [Limnovirga soli]NNV55878.1 outer membrane beta-barrel protein [Limnovirga soli]